MSEYDAKPLTADDLITQLTEAPSNEAAAAIIATVPALTVCAAADLLYVEADFQGIKWLRSAVVREARA